MIDLFEIDPTDGKYHVIGLSGGHDSTCLAVLLNAYEPRRYNFVCTPTADELPEMYDHWNRLSERFGRRIIPVMEHTLKGLIDHYSALPNFNQRWCTRRIKIDPYRRLLQQLTRVAPVVSYVGLRADEEGRAGGAYSDIAGVEMRFPLREWMMGDPEVLSVLNQLGIDVPNRTDCARCYHQRIGEWWELWTYHPLIFADAVNDEARTGHTFRTPGRDSWPTDLKSLGEVFASGRKPDVSLKRLARERMMSGGCRVCTM